MATPPLPATHRALVLDTIGQPLRLGIRDTPQATPGSAVVKILVAGVLSYSRDIYNGARRYALPTPSVPGNGAIGRVAAVGADATKLKPGDLVIVDVYIRGRDDRTVAALSGINDGHSQASKKMMSGEWRDSTYAEYAKLPLENCFTLDEGRLLGSPRDGGLGYTVNDLLSVATLLVAFGGLQAIGLDMCENIIISPATGAFGSAAVRIAVAIGANVIAMGRNIEKLKELQQKFSSATRKDSIQIVQITNNLEQEIESLAKFGPADVFFDVSPPMAAGSTHVKSGALSLKHSGRICLMGGSIGDLPIPAAAVVRKNLTIKGKWMYEREDVLKLIRMVESGVLQLGEKVSHDTSKTFPLEQWKEAFDAAAEVGPGQSVSITL